MKIPAITIKTTITPTTAIVPPGTVLSSIAVMPSAPCPGWLFWGCPPWLGWPVLGCPVVWQSEGQAAVSPCSQTLFPQTAGWVVGVSGGCSFPGSCAGGLYVGGTYVSGVISNALGSNVGGT